MPPRLRDATLMKAVALLGLVEMPPLPRVMPPAVPKTAPAFMERLPIVSVKLPKSSTPALLTVMLDESAIWLEAVS